MTDHGPADDLVGPYALGACSPEEARSVAEHADRCPTCAAEIAELSRAAEWIGMSAARAPDPRLRSRVLSAALTARPAGPPDPRDTEVRRLGELYQVQVTALDRLLGELSLPQWQLPSGAHRSLRGLLVHLYANDEVVAAAAGLDPVPVHARSAATDVHRRWRRQAGALIEVMDRRGAGLLDRPVRLAGRRAVRRPLREALIQRGFETWIHAEDVRRVLALPSQQPGAQQIADIVDFALRLLPAAMVAAGRAHPAQAIRLALSGAGGGTRLVGLSPGGPTAGAVVAEVSLPAERFCKLLAGRLTGAKAIAEIGGDPVAAADFLAVAATMGCD